MRSDTRNGKMTDNELEEFELRTNALIDQILVSNRLAKTLTSDGRKFKTYFDQCHISYGLMCELATYIHEFKASHI